MRRWPPTRCWPPSVAAVAKRGPSVALGEDVRIEGKGAIASGLALDGELVQISAYG